MSTIVTLDDAELGTVLAALRYYQSQGLGDPANRPQEIHDIATAGDTVISLDDGAIDELCERINCGDSDDDGDDCCDLCMSSGVKVDRTTFCGKRIGIGCGCDANNEDGKCDDPSCAECKLAGKETNGPTT